MKLTRAFLIGVVVSLSLAALTGIGAIVFQDSFFGRGSERIILSVLTVALYCLTSLGAAMVLERGVWRVAMWATLALSFLGLLACLAGTWDLVSWGHPQRDLFQKMIALLITWPVVLPVAGLLALTRFTGALALIRLASILAALLTGALLTGLVLADLHGSDVEIIWRLWGVVLILALLGMIATPVLYKVRGIDRQTRTETTAITLRITCPRCLTPQTIAAGHARCVHCRLKFHLEIEEPRCPQCDYLLANLTTPRCSECGVALAADEVLAGQAVPASRSAEQAEPQMNTDKH